MNFRIDASLSRRLACRLREAGHHAIHTLELPARNATHDGVLCVGTFTITVDGS
jgi:predicted nuclease of predicted toxin-antitoxin system